MEYMKLLHFLPKGTIIPRFAVPVAAALLLAACVPPPPRTVVVPAPQPQPQRVYVYPANGQSPEQTERDHEALVKAIKSGRLRASNDPTV